jgi:hypothetical protein
MPHASPGSHRRGGHYLQTCKLFQIDEAYAVAPEDEDMREEIKDALSDSHASHAQGLDLPDLHVMLYYFYLNPREQGVRRPPHRRSSRTAAGVDALYVYTHPEN